MDGEFDVRSTPTRLIRSLGVGEFFKLYKLNGDALFIWQRG